jgi:hypothetical protein
MTNSRRTSRSPVNLMPGPGTGPRPGGWETLCYGVRRHDDDDHFTSWSPVFRSLSSHKFKCFQNSRYPHIYRVTNVGGCTTTPLQMWEGVPLHRYKCGRVYHYTESAQTIYILKNLCRTAPCLTDEPQSFQTAGRPNMDQHTSFPKGWNYVLLENYALNPKRQDR